MRKLFLFIAFCASSLFVFATIRLPKIFTSNMVLQRERPVMIWGWADAGESITLSFNGQTQKVKAEKDGSWQMTLAPLRAGGPFTLKLSGSNTLNLTNILVGDVWVCSGQSNMEWIVKNVNNADKEIATAAHPAIRLFNVKKATGYSAQKDLNGGEWTECNSSTLPDFSAVAYFFGRKLNEDLNVPIGLINSSWGGTNIQAWTSWNIMGQEEKYKSANLAQMEEGRGGMKQKQELFKAGLKNDVGDSNKWNMPSTNTAHWKIMQLPRLWETTEVGNADGNIWFRKEIDLPAAAEAQAVTIHLGVIDDDDVAYFNGTKIGATQGYNIDRVYIVNPSLVRKGKNLLVVKVTDNGGGGGLYGKPEAMFATVAGTNISLAGNWQYKPSIISTQFGIKDEGPNGFPSQLYNAMIAPIIKYGIKGAIWYQGEANTNEAYKYATMFPNMINDWRKQWGYDFPFLWVQLANFMQPAQLPLASEWAELRDAQHKTLSLPQTGEAVIIDLGEAGDIHPRNKQDVGYRLALAAEKTAYQKDVVYSGPQYASSTVEGNKMVLHFNNTGSGLLIKDKYGYLKGFSIAGSDQKFVWAKAYIDAGNLVVYSDGVANPVAVRYAWADNPDDANLYNKEGLPASPFRTDSWKVKTQR